jgi:hypothetical protein
LDLDPTARGGASGLGRRRGVAGGNPSGGDSPEIRDLASPATIRDGIWSGRERGTRGVSSRLLEGARAAVDGGRRREAARPVGKRRAGTGEREGEGKAAGELPHHLVVLRGQMIAGKRRQTGESMVARGADGKAAAAARVRTRRAAAARV